MRGYRSNVSGLYGWNVYSPVCGGYRWCSQPSPAGWKYSPACGGYRRYLTSSRKAQTYSPHAGLSGTLTDTFCTVLVFPRMRGYRLEKQKPHRGRGIPRVGVIGYFWQLVKHFCVFPACGVNGENGNLHKNVFCIPPCAGLSAEIE